MATVPAGRDSLRRFPPLLVVKADSVPSARGKGGAGGGRLEMGEPDRRTWQSGTRLGS